MPSSTKAALSTATPAASNTKEKRPTAFAKEKVPVMLGAP